MTATTKPLTNMTIAELTEALKRAGSRKANPLKIQEILQQGCPTNPDGTINFFTFVAFLAAQ
ncbi:MAG: hypothetical protein Q4D62_07580 [Planctomycetia bacterium]|nr:hypothetical protein [Planctomycetia bacterium]